MCDMLSGLSAFVSACRRGGVAISRGYISPFFSLMSHCVVRGLCGLSCCGRGGNRGAKTRSERPVVAFDDVLTHHPYHLSLIRELVTDSDSLTQEPYYLMSCQDLCVVHLDGDLPFKLVTQALLNQWIVPNQTHPVTKATYLGFISLQDLAPTLCQCMIDDRDACLAYCRDGVTVNEGVIAYQFHLVQLLLTNQPHLHAPIPLPRSHHKVGQCTSGDMLVSSEIVFDAPVSVHVPDARDAVHDSVHVSDTSTSVYAPVEASVTTVMPFLIHRGVRRHRLAHDHWNLDDTKAFLKEVLSAPDLEIGMQDFDTLTPSVKESLWRCMVDHHDELKEMIGHIRGTDDATATLRDLITHSCPSYFCASA